MTNLKKLANFFKMRYPDVAPLTVRLKPVSVPQKVNKVLGSKTIESVMKGTNVQSVIRWISTVAQDFIT